MVADSGALTMSWRRGQQQVQVSSARRWSRPSTKDHRPEAATVVSRQASLVVLRQRNKLNGKLVEIVVREQVARRYGW